MALFILNWMLLLCYYKSFIYLGLRIWCCGNKHVSSTVEDTIVFVINKLDFHIIKKAK